jgi:putative heme-binding domain-containing protein
LLIHTTRIALRDSIRHLKNLPELAKQFEENHAVQSQLAEIALGIGSADAAAYLLDFEERHRSDGTRGEQALEHVARHLDEAMLPRLFQLAGSYQSEQLGRQLSILRALNRSLRSRGIRMPESIVTWADHLAKEFLASDDANRVRRGIEFAQELTLISTAQQLATLAGDDSPHRSLRTQAADALVTVDPPLAVTIIAKLLADPKSDATIKRQAAEALGRLNSAESRGILLDLLRVAPEPLALTIGRSLSSSREGASSLLGSIEKGLASAQLLRDTVIEQRVLAARILDVQQRVAALLDGLPPGDERINQLIASRKTGFQKAKPDSVKGAALFKKHCAACHQIGGTGNKVGPELDGIGLRGRDRLLEDLLDPNRNVDANFRASIIVLESGRVFNGLVLREEGQTLVAVDDKGKPQRIPLNEIEERKQMKLSPMPANVSELLKEDEFYDLLGFLLAQQRKVAPKRPKDR